jgi:hypothetical protein
VTVTRGEYPASRPHSKARAGDRGHQQSAPFCHRLLVTGYWLLITGYWLLATGHGLLVTPAAAQSVSAGSGPLSDVSAPVSQGSRPVHERGRTMREGSAGSMRSGPVRQDTVGSMRSGPVSEISRGAVTSSRPMSGGGSVAAHSAGAVKNELHPSAGEQIYDLQRALAPLQERLRQAEDAGATEHTGADDPMPADDELRDEAIEPEQAASEGTAPAGF